MKKIVTIFLIGALIVGVYLYMNAPRDEDVPESVTEDVGGEVVTDDTGSNAAVQTDVTTVQQRLVGSWQSVDDEKFVRIFRNDGSVIDLHDDEEVSAGSYRFFSSDDPVDVQFPIQEGTVYVQILTSVPTTEVMHFSIDVLTEDMLEMTYMDRGGVLRSVRLP